MRIIKVNSLHHVDIISTLVEAFYHEEFGNWAMDTSNCSDETKRKKLTQYYQLQLKHFAQPFDEVYANQDLSAVALWIPPNRWNLNFYEEVKLLPHLIMLFGLKRLIKVLKVINLVQNYHPKEKHFYLQLVGVHPTEQGKGWSRHVLAPILKYCDQHKFPCYLETATPSNITIYHQHHFEVIHHLSELPYEAPDIWCMWREPQPFEIPK